MAKSDFSSFFSAFFKKDRLIRRRIWVDGAESLFLGGKRGLGVMDGWRGVDWGWEVKKNLFFSKKVLHDAEDRV